MCLLQRRVQFFRQKEELTGSVPKVESALCEMMISWLFRNKQRTTKQNQIQQLHLDNTLSTKILMCNLS